MALPHQDLRRGVAKAARHRRQLLVRLEVLGDPKVCDHERGVGSAGFVDDVFGLEVAVDDLVGVEVGGGGEDLSSGGGMLASVKGRGVRVAGGKGG